MDQVMASDRTVAASVQTVGEQVCDQTFTDLECAKLKERLKKVSHQERRKTLE